MAKSAVGRYEDLVEEMLRRHSNLRDDTGMLYVACVAEIRGLDYAKQISLYEHFKAEELKTYETKIPTLASVIRLNTKLQKKYPEIRGIDWEKKQKHSKDYKEDLGYGKR